MKLGSRLKQTSAYGVYYLASIGTIPISSIWYIKCHDASSWGQFVPYLVLFGVFALLTSFGQRDLLLKEATSQPERLDRLFWESLMGRLPILIGTFLILFLVIRNPTYFWGIALWIASQFIYKSFEAPLIFADKFRQLAVVELLGLVALLTMIPFIEFPQQLMYVFAGIVLIKCLVVGRLPLSRLTFSIELITGYLRKAWPYFIPALAGTLLGKLDLYYGTLYFSDIELGQYQNLMAFVGLIMSIPPILIAPFMKEIFGSTSKLDFHLKMENLLIGVFIVPILVISTYLVQAKFLSIELDYLFYILGGLFALPIYYYLPQIYRLFKHNLQQKVVIATLLAAVVHFVGIVTLGPWLGSIGALTSGTLSQWLFLVLILRENNKIKIDA